MAPLDRHSSPVGTLHKAGDAGVEIASNDDRRASRRRVLKGGIVAFNDRFSTLPCTVRDISATGARLRIEGSINAPDSFELIIELDGLEADCEVVWRKGNDVGVKFRSAPRTLTPRRTQSVNALVPTQKASLRRKPAS